jgi:integrase
VALHCPELSRNPAAFPCRALGRSCWHRPSWRRCCAPCPTTGSARPTGVLYLTAAMTGLRQGELLALRWRDVDWLAARVRVRRNYVRGQ